MSADPSPKLSFGIMKDEDLACSEQNQLNQQTSTTTSVSATPPKKKRSLPGTPNPDAEVIALSPKTLLTTNRFICEVCSKGFQREQNLQLHRRGHNLPWKLKQKSTKEVKKKVYVCPESTCVHHDPSRALGDLTGIKKHFYRKHGEKKWKCEKCSKRYAVQSDWKAHSKTCGTREYRCDCGTLFSRRDSFITHRAFCDALAQERETLPSGLQLCNHHNQSSDMPRLQGGTLQFDHLIQSSNSSLRSLQSILPSGLNQNLHEGSHAINEFHEGSQTINEFDEGSQTINEYLGFSQIPSEFSGSSSNNPSSNLFNLGFLSNKNQSNISHLPASGLSFQDQCHITLLNDHISESVSSLYTSHMQNSTVLPKMSATALLHKVAQMGATATGNNNDTLFGGFGSSTTNSIGLNWQDQRSSSSSSSFPTSNSASFHMTNLDQTKANFNSCQESQLQDIMSSIENGNMRNAFGGIFGARGSENGSDVGDFNATNCLNLENRSIALCNLETLENRHHSVSASSLGGTDGLTRDFLGVGERFIGGGYGQIDHGHEQNVKLPLMDLEIRSYW